jgi:hypothetical protein
LIILMTSLAVVIVAPLSKTNETDAQV